MSWTYYKHQFVPRKHVFKIFSNFGTVRFRSSSKSWRNYVPSLLSVINGSRMYNFKDVVTTIQGLLSIGTIYIQTLFMTHYHQYHKNISSVFSSDSEASVSESLLHAEWCNEFLFFNYTLVCYLSWGVFNNTICFISATWERPHALPQNSERLHSFRISKSQRGKYHNKVHNDGSMVQWWALLDVKRLFRNCVGSIPGD